MTNILPFCSGDSVFGLSMDPEVRDVSITLVRQLSLVVGRISGNVLTPFMCCRPLIECPLLRPFEVGVAPLAADPLVAPPPLVPLVTRLFNLIDIVSEPLSAAPPPPPEPLIITPLPLV